MDHLQSDFKINISLVIFLFCFMFAPPILPINFIIILSMYSIFMLARFYSNRIVSVVKKSNIKKFTFLITLFVLYWFIVVIMNFSWGERIYLSNYVTIFYQILLITPIMMSCIVYIIVRAETLNLNIEQLLVHFILAGAIEAAISLITFISPPMRQLFINIMSRNIGSTFDDFILSVRVYGFANGLYDLFGWGTGIIAALPLFLSKNLQRKYIWFIPLLLLAPLLNARTGLVMFFGGIVLFVLFMNNKNIFSVLKKILLLLAGAWIGYLVFRWIQNNNSKAYWWIMSGIRSFWGTITNNQNSDMKLSTLFSERFWTIPTFPDIIFGTGHNIYIGKAYLNAIYMNYSHSDVGYVNYLWMGGIVGSFMLYGIYFSMFYTAIKYSASGRIRWTLIFLGGSIVVFNIKGQAFTHCPATALIFSILFYSIYLNNERGKAENDI